MALLGNNSSNSGSIEIGSTITITDKIFFQDVSNKQKIEGNSNGDLSFFTNATEIIKINNTGEIDILNDLQIGAPGNDTDIYIGNPLASEIKLRSVGNGHFSIFNMNGLFQINNTGDSGNLGTTGTNLMSITDTGLVGIGITNPSSNLHIKENNNTINQLRLENPNASGSSGLSLHNGTDQFRIELDNSNNRTFIYNGMGGLNIQAAEADIIFSIGYEGSETEQMRIKDNGTIDIKGKLDLTTTVSGFLPPRLTTAQETTLTDIPPTAGECIYNTTTNKLRCWNGTIWNNCF